MLRLPRRPGTRPKTSAGIPHRQLEQAPPAEIYARLLERFLWLPGTTCGESLVSAPGARALFLPGCEPGNARCGFIRGREFAHVHPPADGSFHMALAPDDVVPVLKAGWGELHPWAGTGKILPTITMVYAPRCEQEIDVVMAIASASLANARLHLP